MTSKRKVKWVSPGLSIKETGKTGKGVFAERLFRTGEIVFEVMGTIVEKTLAELTVWQNDAAIQIGKGRFIDPNLDNLGTYICHSCDPNCGIKIEESRVFFIAIRDIKSGEEITFDYSTSMEGDPWVMNCLCGSAQCRGLITEFKWIDPSIQAKYIRLGVVPEFIRLFKNTPSLSRG